MRAVRLSRKFDAALLPYHALNHLPAPEDRRSALAAAARHVPPNGLVIAHALAQQAVRAPLDEPCDVIALAHNERQVRLRVIERTLDEQQRVAEQKVEYSILDREGRVVARSQELLRYAWFSDSEIVDSARAHGLVTERIDESFRSWLPPLQRIYLFRKTASRRARPAL